MSEITIDSAQCDIIETLGHYILITEQWRAGTTINKVVVRSERTGCYRDFCSWGIYVDNRIGTYFGFEVEQKMKSLGYDTTNALSFYMDSPIRDPKDRREIYIILGKKI